MLGGLEGSYEVVVTSAGNYSEGETAYVNSYNE
jgi:hypothetical protein